jgi:ATP-dependent DNA helicase PIF1
MTRWEMVDVLVIDEISMISSELFDMLESTIREIRTEKNGVKPFGGIQLILSGVSGLLNIFNL